MTNEGEYVATLERCLKSERKQNEYLLEKVSLLELQVKELKEKLQEQKK
ncbi:MAG: hypothetical protein AB1403_00580 [Candidatus Riflebacteria bacterium]